MQRKHLITARTSIGLTQREAAEYLGMSQALYALVESGKRWSDERADELVARLEDYAPEVPHTPEERESYLSCMRRILDGFNRDGWPAGCEQ